MSLELTSWGGKRCLAGDITEPLDTSTIELPSRYLAVGAQRSYGDSCLLTSGNIIRTQHLKRVLHFDKAAGVIDCEAGISVSELSKIVMAEGWMLPVVPGTRFVTIGGAVANDVHGKNHHRSGSFGHHVVGITLLNRHGLQNLSLTNSKQLFHATIGGLGLTGLILSVRLRLARMASTMLTRSRYSLFGTAELLDSLAEADRESEYTVSWIDCSSRSNKGIEGYLDCADYAGAEIPVKPEGRFMSARVPNLGLPLINSFTIRLFNKVYSSVVHSRFRQRVHVGYSAFQFPLDGIQHWNRLYGRRGFFQFQAVLPFEKGPQERAREFEKIIRLVQQSALGSPLVVVKLFGEKGGAGMLSFPKRGINIAIDLLNTTQTAQLYGKLESVVRDCSGAIYPAKDALMAPETFRATYPALDAFCAFKDTAAQSDFWRRMEMA